MYNLKNALKLLRNPSGYPGALHQLGMEANKRYYQFRGAPSDFSVMDEDWDNLFLLDGCRFDLFSETINLDGDLETRTSPGSSSDDFIESTFRGDEHHDTVYVTANPYFTRIPDDTFHKIIPVLDEGWDPELNTVPPDVMADAVRDAHQQFPKKRLLVHFIQPHYPFIGERGRTLTQGGVSRYDNDGKELDTTDEGDIWIKLQFRLNDVTEQAVWEAYQENLELVLDEVDSLLDDIDGKTVLSTDHGNLVGDWIGPIPCRGYGHPPNLYVNELIKIPWFIIGGERREVTSDPPVRNDSMADATVANRLQSLGYKS